MTPAPGLPRPLHSRAGGPCRAGRQQPRRALDVAILDKLTARTRPPAHRLLSP